MRIPALLIPCLFIIASSARGADCPPKLVGYLRIPGLEADWVYEMNLDSKTYRAHSRSGPAIITGRVSADCDADQIVLELAMTSDDNPAECVLDLDGDSFRGSCLFRNTQGGPTFMTVTTTQP